MPQDHNPKGNGNLSAYRPQFVQAPVPTAARAIEMFVQGTVLARNIWTVAGPTGLASVPSPTDPSRSCFLMWSQQFEAERWADVLTEEPTVMAVDLAAFLGESLPAIENAGGTLGADWSSEPIEAEIEPGELGLRLREELVRDFAAVALKTRTVWLLRNSFGVAAIDTKDGLDRVVPVWADRATAELSAQALGGDIMTLRMPLMELTSRYLLSSEGVKARMAPGYVHAPGAIAMSPWAFKALLNTGGRPTARVA